MPRLTEAEKKVRKIERKVTRTKPKLQKVAGTGMEVDVLRNFWNTVKDIIDGEDTTNGEE